jgi:putative transposon-encoded protein
VLWFKLGRKVEINQTGLCLIDSEIEGFLERTVTPIGTSAKADIPKRYLGRRVYIIITKEEGTNKE